MNHPATKRVPSAALTDFCANVFAGHGIPAADARGCAEVLVAADVRGIPSHGVARLQRYVDGIRTRQMLPDPPIETLRESPMSLVLDAGGGMGAPISVRVMQTLLDKAAAAGAAFGCIRNSNHFGIAGYYAMMALERDMIGIAMTNTAALGVPTFGRSVMFGTNPLAFCAPALAEKAFVLDMSTTVVSRGKIEVYEKAAKPLPLGWAVDKSGQPATNAHAILEDMFHRYGGGILPLGGFGEEFGGYKGYGLAVMVDILCAVLGGAPFGDAISDTATSSARVSHFFGAIDIRRFREPEDFKRDMDEMLRRLRHTPVADGQQRVYYAGLKEFEFERQTAQAGIPLPATTVQTLTRIGREIGLTF